MNEWLTVLGYYSIMNDKSTNSPNDSNEPTMKTTIKTYTLNLPNFWCSALINHDYSGLEEEEIQELNKFIEFWQDDLIINSANIESDENAYFDSHFMKYHDVIDLGILACDCCEYTFQINPKSSLYETN
tara:strand:- start:1486 stop:1872 length:387 start_codon:yes stop_codon:yes gene_type:complete